MKTENGPTLWANLLDLIDVPGAIVAGGCVRDYHLGLPFNDIDIFAPGGGSHDLYYMAARVNSSGENMLTLMPGAGSYSNANDPVLGIVEGHIKGIPVNVITNDLHNRSEALLVDGFDFGITKAWWSRETGFQSLPAFVVDERNKTATLTTDRSYERSLKRFQKFIDRNGPVLTLVDPFVCQIHAIN